MDEYTSNFFKIIIRSLQTSRQFLDLSFVKKIVDHLISGEKLLVVVNSLPLYLAIQMFFEPEQIDKSESLILKVQKVVYMELEKIKQGKISADSQNTPPIILFYRLKNLIHVSTSMLQYFLCFQTPIGEKSSSSQIHSSNSQQYNQSPTQHPQNSQRSFSKDLNSSQPDNP